MAYSSVEEYLQAPDTIERSDQLKRKILEYFVDEEGTHNYVPVSLKMFTKNRRSFFVSKIVLFAFCADGDKAER